jgi:hypothetical protein
MHNDIFPHSRNLRRLTAALVLTCCIGVGAQTQSSPPPAAVLTPTAVLAPVAVLVNEVVANELADREERRSWMYLLTKQEGPHTLTEEQVDTKDGPLYRVLAVDGTPLNAEQRQKDDARIDEVLHDPAQQLSSKLDHDKDEQKLQTLMRLMPRAFLYDYDGVEGDLVRVRFRPNPNYSPATYEARVVHSLAGTILIDAKNKRLAMLSGQLIDRVEFGFGILGRIDKDGTVEVRRVQVDGLRWKTCLIHIAITGRLVLFKTVNKQEYETRSAFHALPRDTSLLEASRLLAALK